MRRMLLSAWKCCWGLCWRTGRRQSLSSPHTGFVPKGRKPGVILEWALRTISTWSYRQWRSSLLIIPACLQYNTTEPWNAYPQSEKEAYCPLASTAKTILIPYVPQGPCGLCVADCSRPPIPPVCPSTGLLLPGGAGSGGAAAPSHSATPERRNQWPGEQSAAGTAGRYPGV